MDMRLAVERRPGAQVSHWWWEQGSLDLEGMWVVARAAEMAEMEGGEDGNEQDY